MTNGSYFIANIPNKYHYHLMIDVQMISLTVVNVLILELKIVIGDFSTRNHHQSPTHSPHPPPSATTASTTHNLHHQHRRNSKNEINRSFKLY
jgi:hypothetical protein